MDKNYNVLESEQKYSQVWQNDKTFEASFEEDSAYFSIVLPPPNANGNLHVGHVMYVYEDIMVRYQKSLGKNVLWLPGRDHAGIETQFVFEKHLAKQGKSRFDFTREELFQEIANFVALNSNNMKSQLQSLGFALDWEKEKYTLDPDIVLIVKETFAKLFSQDLVYRANRLVNYCTRDGTAFSDLEILDEEKEGELYYLKYKLSQGSDFLIVATTRPETIFADLAVMVHPKDKRYQKFIGKFVKIPLSGQEIPVIADDAVKMDFATGVVKVTPSHDRVDAEVGLRHHLGEKQIIGLDGKFYNTGFVDGLRTKAAREKTIALLNDCQLLEKISAHKGLKKLCYKCKGEIETLPLPQWYVKTKPLAKEAIKAIKNQEIKFFPSRYTKLALRWLENIIDWNISRQIVWGIQIPAYRCQKTSSEQEAWFVDVSNNNPSCQVCGKCTPIADTDTFDTWFSSGQWPFATLMSLEKQYPQIMNYFPLSVMETGSEILYFWVCRMIMLSLFVTGKVPFSQVFLHGTVRDKLGQKMSKSKGNVVNPSEFISKYGADALRASLLFGAKDGNDVNVSEEKVKAMRNFANKIWNMTRLIITCKEESQDLPEYDLKNSKKTLTKLQDEFAKLEVKYHKNMNSLHFNKNFDMLYEFIWRRIADFYLEELKVALRSSDKTILNETEGVFVKSIKFLQPFMPFVSERILDELSNLTQKQ